MESRLRQSRSRSASRALLHPAFLLNSGNTALAFGQAHVPAISLSAVLSLIIFVAHYFELRRGRSFGVPFSILAAVNIVVALSIQINTAIPGSFDGTLERTTIAAHVSAFAYVLWATGSLFAGRIERRQRRAENAIENPQTYYGIGDLAAINAGGHVNVLALPFMIVGFLESLRVGRRSVLPEAITAARLYGAGYLIGTLTSLSTPQFAVAQALWALAYFRFASDK